MNRSDRTYIFESLDRTSRLILATDKKDKFGTFLEETLKTADANWSNQELKAYHKLAGDYLLFLNR